MAIDSRNKRGSAGSLMGMEILPLADGAIGAPDRLQVAGLYAGIAAAAGIVWTELGAIFLYTEENWPGKTPWFEVCMYASVKGTTILAELWDDTGLAAVAGSRLTTAVADLDRVRTATDLTLVDGREYRVRFGIESPDDGTAVAARLIFM